MKILCNLVSFMKRSAIQRFNIFKLILFNVIVFIVLLFSCTKQEKVNDQLQNANAEIRNDVCFDELIENSCPNQVPFFETHTLDNIPGYPANCTFKIRAKVLNCNDPNNPLMSQFFILSFELIEVNCDQYEYEINEIISNPGINLPTLDDYLTGLYEKLYRRFEDVYFDPFKIFFSCGSSSQIWFNITHIRESCSRFCVYLTGGEGSYLATPINCGTGCCKTEARMCFNTSTQKIEKTITTTPLTESQCEPPSPVLPYGCFLATPCKFICTQ